MVTQESMKRALAADRAAMSSKYEQRVEASSENTAHTQRYRQETAHLPAPGERIKMEYQSSSSDYERPKARTPLAAIVYAALKNGH